MSCSAARSTRVSWTTRKSRFSPLVFTQLVNRVTSAAARRKRLTRTSLAPLSKEAGGWGACPNVFASKNDHDFRKMSAAVAIWQSEWQKSHAFGSPTFQVNHQYIREMARFGIIPENTRAEDINPYEADQRYWEIFHYKPKAYEDKISKTTQSGAEKFGARIRQVAVWPVVPARSAQSHSRLAPI